MKRIIHIEKSRMNNYGFQTSLNTAVFTTSFIINEKKPITYVSHEIEDGAWQFFSDDEFIDFEKVAKLVSLEEIIELDPSIIELSDLKEGYVAFRKTQDYKWVIKKSE
jgi:hypothetical protein